jgi:kinesin family protein 6/9
MKLSEYEREILDDFENNAPSSRKFQHRITGNENINKLCWDWFQDFID